MGGCGDDDAAYALSLKHAGVPGLVASLVVSAISVGFVLGTIVSVTWKLPKLTAAQTRALMAPNRRVVLISFLVSLLLVDFMSIHAWRLLGGDGACIPSPDWFMLWSAGTVLAAICLLTAWLHPPYAPAMIHTAVVAYALIVLYYLFTTLARNQFCGSMFVATPSLIMGVVNIFMIPQPLRLDLDEFESLPQVVGRTIARVTRGPVSHDPESVSVHLNLDDPPPSRHSKPRSDPARGLTSGARRSRRIQRRIQHYSPVSDHNDVYSSSGSDSEIAIGAQY